MVGAITLYQHRCWTWSAGRGSVGNARGYLFSRRSRSVRKSNGLYRISTLAGARTRRAGVRGALQPPGALARSSTSLRSFLRGVAMSAPFPLRLVIFYCPPLLPTPPGWKRARSGVDTGHEVRGPGRGWRRMGERKGPPFFFFPSRRLGCKKA